MAKKLKIIYYKQKKDFTCGPACLQMVFNFFGKKRKQQYISKLANTTHKSGTRNIDMINAVRKEGFYYHVYENGTLDQIRYFVDCGLPVIIEYVEPSGNEVHFSVVIGYNSRNIIMNDPWNGKDFALSIKKFGSRWYDTHKNHTCTCWLMAVSDKKINLGKKYPLLKKHN